jgi:hypothetical protein
MEIRTLVSNLGDVSLNGWNLIMDTLNYDPYNTWLAVRTLKHSTDPLRLYALEMMRWMEFTAYILQLYGFASTNPKHFDAYTTWLLSQVGEYKVDGLREVLDTYGLEIMEIRPLEQHSSLIAELLISRMVDNFLAYIGDLLNLIFRTRPETLRSAEKEQLDFILQFSSMEELIHALAEKRVERLAFSTQELFSYFEEKLGFVLFEVEDTKEKAVRIIETRNIIVHNRSIVSSTFKKRVPNHPANLGDRLNLTMLDMREYDAFLMHAVFDIDRRTVAKFKLPYRHLRLPPFESEQDAS